VPFPNPATQFKPGNPGRPKGRSISDRLNALLEAKTFEGKKNAQGKQILDLLAEAIVKQALKGDLRFIDLILQRTEWLATAGSADPTEAGDVATLRQHLEQIKAASEPPVDRELLGGPPGKPARVRKPRGAP